MRYRLIHAVHIQHARRAGNGRGDHVWAEMEEVMITAHEVAQELRMLADTLDREPDAEIGLVEVDFNCKYRYTEANNKKAFLALAHLLPRPLQKGVQSYDSTALELKYKSEAMIVTTEIKRSVVCKLIEPEKVISAVYECEPLLSVDEEAALPVTA
jgi:hypothetical protein